jgi:hypothetical protein
MDEYQETSLLLAKMLHAVLGQLHRPSFHKVKAPITRVAIPTTKEAMLTESTASVMHRVYLQQLPYQDSVFSSRLITASTGQWQARFHTKSSLCIKISESLL